MINAIKNTSGQNYFLNQVSQIHFNLLQDLIKSKNNLKILPLYIENLTKLYAFGTVQLLCEWLINDMPIDIKYFSKILEDGLPEPLKKFLY